MTSAYVPSGTVATKNTTARSSAVQNEFQSVADGLNTFPAADSLSKNTVTYAVDSGAANAYILTYTTPFTSYTDGMSIVMKAGNANTTTSTVDVDGLGARQIRRQTGDVLTTGDILAGQILEMRYNGTYFVLMAYANADVITVVQNLEAIAANAALAAGVTAASLSITPPDGMSATNFQDAIVELNADVQAALATIEPPSWASINKFL